MELRSILQAEQSTRKSIPQPSQSPSRAPSPISNFYATNFPSDGEGTLSGVIVEADEKTGLATKVLRIISGGVLKK